MEHYDLQNFHLECYNNLFYMNQNSLYKMTYNLLLSPKIRHLYPKKSVRIPFTSFSPQDLALVLKLNGSTFSFVPSRVSEEHILARAGPGGGDTAFRNDTLKNLPKGHNTSCQVSSYSE